MISQVNTRAKNITIPIIMIGILSYFGYHALEGNHGLRANRQLSRDIVKLEQRAALLHAEKQSLERKVALLHPENLDPDLLAERTREVLGFTHPDEIIILDPPSGESSLPK